MYDWQQECPTLHSTPSTMKGFNPLMPHHYPHKLGHWVLSSRRRRRRLSCQDVNRKKALSQKSNFGDQRAMPHELTKSYHELICSRKSLDLSVKNKKLFWRFVMGTWKSCGEKQKMELGFEGVLDDVTKLWIGNTFRWLAWAWSTLGCLLEFGILEVNNISVIHDHSLWTVLKIERKG